MSEPAMTDWTSDDEAIVYQRCTACGAVQYFRRDFCAACGSNDLATLLASGEGTVYAATLVHRAATAEAREHVPFKIVLVDTAEGFRMMAHGANDLAVGDRVRARFTRFTGRRVPYFERTSA
ncbi:OB-fold domain-containing protein [Rhodopseudomonas sp. HC1]|uniref:Zn-ribbon domain-containing OB-fold protein n=1 Tax=Rhodopseudomonas infernalis TaxID=2897386 RepID=UPI001EE82696|nr:OB-fold domain-containing protein [Rhodopseudomonas infernalis]MCG6206744.1 OB-fold domain-containing protein [Rhodopseudomonas infernalis]